MIGKILAVILNKILRPFKPRKIKVFFQTVAGEVYSVEVEFKKYGRDTVL